MSVSWEESDEVDSAVRMSCAGVAVKRLSLAWPALFFATEGEATAAEALLSLLRVLSVFLDETSLSVAVVGSVVGGAIVLRFVASA